MRAWNEGDDDVPPGYAHDALRFQQDLRSVLDELQKAQASLACWLEKCGDAVTTLMIERDAARAEVERLREALTLIDALDPEANIAGFTADAARGLVVRMGREARAALAGEGSDD